MATWATKPVEAYLDELDSEHPRIRRQAAAALEILGDQRAIEQLIERLADVSADVRANAARALGKLGDFRAVLALSQTLRADREVTVRESAGRALWRLAHPGAIEALAAALDDSAGRVRYVAGLALTSRHYNCGRSVRPPLTAAEGVHADLWRRAKQITFANSVDDW